MNDPKDRFTIHHRSVKSSTSIKVSSSLIRVLWWLKRSLGSHWVVQDFETLTDDLRRSNVQGLPTTLKGATKVWFGKLPSGTIANFNQLNKGFVHYLIGGQWHKKPTGHLLNICQAEGESLRKYVKCFNKELLQVNKVEDQVILTTFQIGFLLGDFFYSITKSLPKIIVIHKA